MSWTITMPNIPYIHNGGEGLPEIRFFMNFFNGYLYKQWKIDQNWLMSVKSNQLLYKFRKFLGMINCGKPQNQSILVGTEL